jgi:hypothetical protein
VLLLLPLPALSQLQPPLLLLVLLLLLMLVAVAVLVVNAASCMPNALKQQQLSQQHCRQPS